VHSTVQTLDTPSLLLDRDRLDRNLDRLAARLRTLGVPLRPHVKTAKSIPVIQRALVGQPGGVTVSTLREAEACVDAGITDILYAVGIAPQKLDRVAALRARGAEVTIILDSLAAAVRVRERAAALGVEFPTLIELDSDGHRAGVAPEAPILLEIGRALGPLLRGVMTHAGESYHCDSEEALRAMAERERAAAVRASEQLRADAQRCDIVSVGSTPTALFATDLTGVTEVRAGVHMFMDLVMAGLGVCTTDDIAISVLTTVIGHQVEKGWILTDAGWMALSRDRGTGAQRVDQGYGVVCDEAGHPIGDLIVTGANQEHGIVASRGQGKVDLAAFPVGRRLRVLPIHACATAAQFGEYHLLAAGALTGERWPRFGGW
jgi:D-serine deaminase-like pyridoxal phosphate-dependent protein